MMLLLNWTKLIAADDAEASDTPLIARTASSQVEAQFDVDEGSYRTDDVGRSRDAIYLVAARLHNVATDDLVLRDDWVASDGTIAYFGKIIFTSIFSKIYFYRRRSRYI